MADLESVLADVSYLMAMERSKAPGAKTIRKFTLPDRRLVCCFVARSFVKVWVHFVEYVILVCESGCRSMDLYETK